MTLHVLVLDKFTQPFYNYVTEVIDLPSQIFLFITDKPSDLKPSKNLFWIKSPIRKNIFFNLKLFLKLCFKADRIVLHGDPLLHFFMLFPFFIKKTSWLIYGQELYSLNKETGTRSLIKKFVLSRVKNHITHIKGDSDLANSLLNSKAKFIYSPMYLSNVVVTSQFQPTKVSEKSKLTLMVGNSTDPTNNHRAIFEKILKRNDIAMIYCPLSYGMYEDYKNEIKALGHELFGNKFVPIEKFMSFEEYKTFLTSIDVVIFNHNRQEAMGVTLTLLSLGKIIYVNPDTTSYESLTRRGCQIYDIALIDNEGLKVDRDVSENVFFLNQYYSKKVYDESLELICKS
jgi:hypothetical protein